MKSSIKIIITLLVLNLASLVVTKVASAQPVNVSYQVFYDQLSPYGQWVDYPNYGYVWMPYAGQGFVPYSSGGYWLFTDYGWTWVSDYSWGWAPFHYGRWGYDNFYGWYWVPGNDWGPAWVTWRRGNGYYGWQPMEPGVSISASFGSNYQGYNNHWVFVRDQYIDSHHLNQYYVDQADRERIIVNSTVINNSYVDERRHTSYVTGPDREDVQKNTGRSFKPVAVTESNNPGQDISNSQLRIYRPQVINNSEDEHNPVPGRITKLNEVKRSSDRNEAYQTRYENMSGYNYLERRTLIVKPLNENNNLGHLSQPRKVNPSSTSQGSRQWEMVNPQNDNNRPRQLSQPRKVNSTNSNQGNQQRGMANPQNNRNNNNMQRETKTYRNNNGEQQPKTNRPSNQRQDNRH